VWRVISEYCICVCCEVCVWRVISEYPQFIPDNEGAWRNSGVTPRSFISALDESDLWASHAGRLTQSKNPL
jgi:hypothetical protein